MMQPLAGFAHFHGELSTDGRCGPGAAGNTATMELLRTCLYWTLGTLAEICLLPADPADVEEWEPY